MALTAAGVASTRSIRSASSPAIQSDIGGQQVNGPVKSAVLFYDIEDAGLQLGALGVEQAGGDVGRDAFGHQNIDSW